MSTLPDWVGTLVSKTCVVSISVVLIHRTTVSVFVKGVIQLHWSLTYLSRGSEIKPRLWQDMFDSDIIDKKWRTAKGQFYSLPKSVRWHIVDYIHAIWNSLYSFVICYRTTTSYFITITHFPASCWYQFYCTSCTFWQLLYSQSFEQRYTTVALIIFLSDARDNIIWNPIQMSKCWRKVKGPNTSTYLN